VKHYGIVPNLLEPAQVELAEKLCTATGMDKAFFANSGAEVMKERSSWPASISTAAAKIVLR
jgi:acetylornithine/succinyldiaminopimelate/putrescine aminotransferase